MQPALRRILIFITPSNLHGLVRSSTLPFCRSNKYFGTLGIATLGGGEPLTITAYRHQNQALKETTDRPRL